MRSLQFTTKHVFFSGAVPALAQYLPDHCWLDSDQQYHVLCNYHYEEAIIAVYFFCKAHCCAMLDHGKKNIKLNEIETFTHLKVKRLVKNGLKSFWTEMPCCQAGQDLLYEY